MTAVAAVFWVAAGLLVYAQVGYPLLLELLGRARRGRTIDAGPDAGEPSVSLVIAAHREAAIIEAKVANARALDWPAERLEVIVACDGSPDDTPARARAAGADIVLDLPWGGKVRAQDAAVDRAGGELLAFSDANALWEPDALRALAAPFADAGVGYACGQVRFVNDGGTNQEGLYWRYEMAIRARESRLASVTAGNGAIYAVRPEAYLRVDPVMGHDLSLPFNMVKRGLARGLRPGRARDREDGAHRRGRVRPQAAHDEPRLADRPARRPALPARLPAALRADDRLAPRAALRHALPARRRAGRQRRAARRAAGSTSSPSRSSWRCSPPRSRGA